MIQTYPQIGSNRLSGDEDEWRILIRWKQEAPTTLLTLSQALCEVERLQEADEHEIAARIREAVECAPLLRKSGANRRPSSAATR
jgi:hypothetical protein